MAMQVAGTISREDPNMAPERPGYRAYLLRLWQVRNGEEVHWRASLQEAYTGERHGFANLEAMFEFLGAKTEGASDATAESARKPFNHKDTK